MRNQNALPEEPPRDDAGQDVSAGLPDPAQPTPGGAAVPAVNSERHAGEPVSDGAPAETAGEGVPSAGQGTGLRRSDRGKQRMPGSIAGSTWVALIIGLLILILLIVFILQNQQQIVLNLFAWTFQFPAGVGYLITAIAGGLIVAMVGMVRMIELHRQVRKLRRQLQ